MHLTSPLVEAMDIKGTYESRSGSVCFEITLDSHVALDVHTKIQERNSYCFIFQTISLTEQF